MEAQTVRTVTVQTEALKPGDVVRRVSRWVDYSWATVITLRPCGIEGYSYIKLSDRQRTAVRDNDQWEVQL
jgi:hypothetical protein